MIYTSKYNCTLGEILLASDGKNLTGLWFKGQKNIPNLNSAKEMDDLPIFSTVKIWLDKYFKGEIPKIGKIPLELEGTEFQIKVWNILREIPYGNTITYSEVAKKLNIKSARAIGNAVGRNPISIIIPCHRVIGKSGSLTGYAAGIDKKTKLLKLEKVL